MGTWSKILLSGSTNGQGISVTGLTPSTGTLVHTAITGSGGAVDSVILYAHNTVTTARELSLAIGPTTAPNSRYTQVLPALDLAGVQPVMPGLIVNNAQQIRAYATAVDGVRVFGWVNRFVT